MFGLYAYSQICSLCAINRTERCQQENKYIALPQESQVFGASISTQVLHRILQIQKLKTELPDSLHA